MVKVLPASIIVLGLCASAHAAPSATSKQAATPSPAHTYWLSDGLNRLVFWQARAASPQDGTKPAH